MTQQQQQQQQAGSKKVYTGPKHGKYVIVMCDGHKKKRYLKKSS